MSAKAVLKCRPNSHPFNDRVIILNQPVKIGRSVARVRPQTNNAIFDCKVLSRNHALLWFENGKFYLQDTKSSNGTFVNHKRLAKVSSEDDPKPMEVFNNDKVQFGVDVTENTRKVTQLCIVATLKLFLPTGEEHKERPFAIYVETKVPDGTLVDLYMYLQNALKRQDALEKNIKKLQGVLESTKNASDVSWKTIVNEDKLLTRVDILENQLSLYNKNITEDKLREIMHKLIEDKERYQEAAKESIKKLVDEKVEAHLKARNLEKTLETVQKNYVNLQEQCEKNKNVLTDLGKKYAEQLLKADELSLKIVETGKKYQQERKEIELERKRLQAKLKQQDKENEEQEKNNENNKNAREVNDSNLKECDMIENQSQQTNNKFADDNVNSDASDSDGEYSTEVSETSETIKDYDSSGDEEEVKDLDQYNQSDVDKLQCLYDASEKELKASEDEVKELHAQLERFRHLARDHYYNAAQLHVKMCDLEEQMKLVERGMFEEKYLDNITLSKNNENAAASEIENLKAEIESLKELREEARNKAQQHEQEVSRYEQEYDNARFRMIKATDEADMLKKQLQAAKEEIAQQNLFIEKLIEQNLQAEPLPPPLSPPPPPISPPLISPQEIMPWETDNSSKDEEEMENFQRMAKDLREAIEQSQKKTERTRALLSTAIKEAEAKTSDIVREHEDNTIDMIVILKYMQNEIKRIQCPEEILSEVELKEVIYKEIKKKDASAKTVLNEMMPEFDTFVSAVKTRKEKIQKLEEDLAEIKENYSQLFETEANLEFEKLALENRLQQTTRNDNYFGVFVALVILVVAYFAYVFFIRNP